MIAPITHPYPPPGYGPWERVTHDLTEQLVTDGVEVTLFAPEGSDTTARLVATVPHPLSVSGSGNERLHETSHIAQAMELASEGAFDVLHSHLHVHALVFSGLIPTPLLTTLHGAAWDPAHHPILRRYADRPYVAVSNRERALLPELNYVATIHHGLRFDEFSPGRGDGGYLAFVGRIAPEKGPDLAVETARLAGLPLRIAGPRDDAHPDYFESVIGGLDGDVEYVGPLDRDDLAGFLGRASGLLMPLRWHEPFGLVVIEAMAAGTPVVAWNMGAMPEIVDEGMTGFLVDDVAGAAAAASRLHNISRAICRGVAENRFGAARMAADYAATYRRVADQPIAVRI